MLRATSESNLLHPPIVPHRLHVGGAVVRWHGSTHIWKYRAPLRTIDKQTVLGVVPLTFLVPLWNWDVIREHFLSAYLLLRFLEKWLQFLAEEWREMLDWLPRQNSAAPSSLVPASFQTWPSWRPSLPVSLIVSRSIQGSSPLRRRQQLHFRQPFASYTVEKPGERRKKCKLFLCLCVISRILVFVAVYSLHNQYRF